MRTVIGCVLALGLWLLATHAPASAAPGQVRLTWDAVTTCLDGTSLPAQAPLTYTLYQASQPGAYNFEQPWVSGVPTTSVIVAAPGRKYWVATATCTGSPCPCGVESPPSNELETHQTGNPKQLR